MNQQERNKLEETQKTFNKINVFVDTTSRRGLTISFNKKEAIDITVNSPIHFTLGYGSATAIAESIIHTGHFGKRVLKALADSVRELDNESINILRVYTLETHHPDEMVKYFIDWFYTTVEAQGVYINRHRLSKQAMRNLYFSFGGFRGCKSLFANGIDNVINEIKRIKSIEDKFEQENPSIKNGAYALLEMAPDDIRIIPNTMEYNPCLTCKHCRVDMYGCRVCKKAYIDVPEELTVRTVNQQYPKADIRNYGNLSSEYIFHNPGRCKYRKSRIGYSVYSHKREYDGHKVTE